MNMYGITKIKTHIIRANVIGAYNRDTGKIETENSAETLVNDFISKHNGNIIDIQMQKIDYNEVHIMIVYTENGGKIYE